MEVSHAKSKEFWPGTGKKVLSNHPKFTDEKLEPPSSYVGIYYT
jgi:hypothetical protein